jgi:uncharacterized membrane protein
MMIILIRPNLFDLRTLLFAKQAQHVVLVHFPIALVITAVAFDVVADWSQRRSLADAAYYNLLAASISTPPVIATGILARQLLLHGQKLKGALLLHLILGSVSGVLIWFTCWLHFRARRKKEALPGYRFAMEFLAGAMILVTSHLGGFLSGVNMPG